MLIQWAREAKAQQESNCMFRRLYPLRGIADTPWGSGWAVIEPNSRTTPHWHDEDETFIVLSGRGEMRVGDELREVSKGDVVYIPRCSAHTLRNIDAKVPLEMLCIWWGGDENTVSHEVDL